MLEDYKSSINLELVLKEKYNYTFTTIQDLLKQDFIEMETNGVDATFWITYNNKKYLFKSLRDPKINIWGELLSEKFANLLNIPCAKYRKCTIGNISGIITESFLDNSEILLHGSDIFQHYLNINNIKFTRLYKLFQISEKKEFKNKLSEEKYVFSQINNYKNIEYLLKKNKNISNEDLNNILNFFISKLLIFDIITLQYDRHPNNWALIKSQDSTYRFANIFDNSVSFGLGYLNMENRITIFSELFANKNKNELYKYIYSVKPNLSVSNKELIPSMLLSLLSICSKETVLEITKTIQQLSVETIISFIRQIEKENNITIDENLYYYLTNIFELHIVNLKAQINNYWRQYKNDNNRKLELKN